jgi:hypothetical protein
MAKRPRRLALLALLAGVLVAVPGPQRAARAAFAGGNGRIASVSAGAGPLEEVFLPADGSTTQVTKGPVQDLMPSWQPR